MTADNQRGVLRDCHVLFVPFEENSGRDLTAGDRVQYFKPVAGRELALGMLRTRHDRIIDGHRGAVAADA